MFLIFTAQRANFLFLVYILIILDLKLMKIPIVTILVNINNWTKAIMQEKLYTKKIHRKYVHPENRTTRLFYKPCLKSSRYENVKEN